MVSPSPGKCLATADDAAGPIAPDGGQPEPGGSFRVRTVGAVPLRNRPAIRGTSRTGARLTLSPTRASSRATCRARDSTSSGVLVSLPNPGLPE